MIRKIISSIKIFEFELRKIDNGIVIVLFNLQFGNGLPELHLFVMNFIILPKIQTTR
ncbi:hypothetical protein BN938_0339 [Mucinivorans hirudinis]|uniref:Uncharacterized protein n=1 Tax=Mucinivorans hirudinis TaxID=1433126 RepID=A0A060R683_9BACT|nr:hypothetical protein BN938_0339 [Mucinivorans hirudinis]